MSASPASRPPRSPQPGIPPCRRPSSTRRQRPGAPWRAVAVALGFLASTASAQDLDLLRGQRNYLAACAACHGPHGRYDPALPGVQSLDPKPADFSDPLFNSREPAGDWFMVTKHGGALIGFSAAMPAFTDAFSDAEIEEMIAHLKTLAGEHNYPPGDLNYLLAFRTKKAWIEDEVVYFNRFTRRPDGEDAVANALEFEKRWFARWQTELKLVHEFEGGQGQWDEVEAGAKYVLYDHLPRTFLLSGGADFAVSLRSGNEAEAIPFLAAAKGLGEAFTLQTSLKSHLPFRDPGGGDLEWASVVHWMPTPWPRGVFPGLELTARAPFQPGDQDEVQWTLLPQFNFGLSRRGHVRAAAGVEIPLNQRTYDFRFHAYVLWDFADGMFWEGWRKGRAQPAGISEYE
ncbi:MAG: cytochrome c [Verrucomicrobiales bacterium]|nr:cytochrome c [Verrucomicrobiales bacterium]